jgi:hypothetical protein
MAAYDAVLKEWPVEYETLHVPTGLGTTHVIASGPAHAPPVLLLAARPSYVPFARRHCC